MFPYILLLGLSATAASLDCHWLDHFSQRTQACLRQLHLMGDGLDMLTDIHFPNKLYQSIRHQNVDCQLAFVQESLQHIFHLYRHGNVSSVGWDVERFLSTLYSQISRLSPCVSTNQSENVNLNKYYKRLNTRLMRTNGSLATWQNINHITRVHLHRLNNLVESIRLPTTGDRYGRDSTGTHHEQKNNARTRDGQGNSSCTRRRQKNGTGTHHYLALRS